MCRRPSSNQAYVEELPSNTFKMYQERGSDFDRAVAEALADEDDGDDAIFTNIEDLILLRGSDLAPAPAEESNSDGLRFQKYMLTEDNSVLKDQDAIENGLVCGTNYVSSVTKPCEALVEEISVEVPKAPVYRNDNAGTKWTDGKTNALLSCLQKHSHKFRRKSIRRNTIWVEIALNMTKLGFILCNKDDCSKKWNNLYRTYKRIEPNKDASASWKYFRIVKQLIQLLNWPFSSVLQANLSKKQKVWNPKVFADFLNTVNSNSETRKRAMLSFRQKVSELDLTRNKIFQRISPHFKDGDKVTSKNGTSGNRKDSTVAATGSGLVPPQVATLNTRNIPRECNDVLPSGMSYYLIPWLDPAGNANSYQILQVQRDSDNIAENNHVSVKDQATTSAAAIAAAEAYCKRQLQGPPPQVATFNSKNLPIEFNAADFLPMGTSYHLIQLDSQDNEETDPANYQILQVQRDA